MLSESTSIDTQSVCEIVIREDDIPASHTATLKRTCINTHRPQLLTCHALFISRFQYFQ